MDREGRAIDAELGQRVYMCGLARTQEAYETSLARGFAALDQRGPVPYTHLPLPTVHPVVHTCAALCSTNKQTEQ